MNQAQMNENDAAAPGGASSAALWASAFVILAMVMVQAGRLPAGPSAAYAGNVSSTGDLTVLTAAGGDNQDVLLVLDRRLERVFVYGVENRNSVKIYENHELPKIFQSARSTVSGGRTGRP